MGTMTAPRRCRRDAVDATGGRVRRTRAGAAIACMVPRARLELKTRHSAAADVSNWYCQIVNSGVDTGPCEHGVKQRSKCKVCSACPHGRERNRCKECGGSSICEHGRERPKCKECGGSSVCEHRRLRHQCKECDGSQICEHDRVRSQCKECGGSRICEHGRQRYFCKECGGGAYCEHGRERRRCKKCIAVKAGTKS